MAILLCCLPVFMVLGTNATANTVTTVVGGGGADGIPAVDSFLNSPGQIAFDPMGNLYVADYYNNRIRKISPSGVISTFAGTGRLPQGAIVPNGVLAADANIAGPFGLAVGPDGSIYFSETLSHRIRRVSPSGVISTIAGTGTAGFTGDGGQVAGAAINAPSGITLGSDGTIYFADSMNHRIRKIAPNGVITTIAGTGVALLSGDGGTALAASFSNPQGIAIDSQGQIYVADKGNNRVRKIAVDGIVSSLADGGYATVVGSGMTVPIYGLFQPYGVTIDENGDCLIADTGNSRVLRVSAAGNASTLVGSFPTFAGDGGLAINARVNRPKAITTAGGSIYISDTENHRIRKIDSSNIISTTAGVGINFLGDGLQATNIPIQELAGMTIGLDEKLYFIDYKNKRVRRVETDGSVITVAGNGTFGFGGENVSATSVGLGSPISLAADRAGRIFILDAQFDKIWSVSSGGLISTYAGGGMNSITAYIGPATNASLLYPTHIHLSRTGELFVNCNDSIRAIDVLGNIRQVQNGSATGLTTNWLGGFYFSTFIPGQVMHRDNGGLTSVFAGSGQSGSTGDGGLGVKATMSPYNLASDAAGNVYLVDRYATPRIRRVNAAGLVSTVAGGGGDAGGEGINATSASIDARQIARSESGALYFSEIDRIKKVTFSDLPSAPSGVTVRPGNGRAALSATPPQYSGGAAILGYLAECGTAGAVAISKSPTLTISPMTNGESIQCRAFAINTNGVGPPSEFVSVTPSASATFELIGVYAATSHGGPGSHMLPINLQAMTPQELTVDPRGSTSGTRQIVVMFTNNVLSVTSISASTGAVTYSIAGNDLILNLIGELNNSRVDIALTGINGQIDLPFSIVYSLGDVSKSRAVNAVDINAQKAQIGRNITFANFEFDVNGSGKIDIDDVRLIKSRSGQITP